MPRRRGCAHRQDASYKCVYSRCVATGGICAVGIKSTALSRVSRCDLLELVSLSCRGGATGLAAVVECIGCEFPVALRADVFGVDLPDRGVILRHTMPRHALSVVFECTWWHSRVALPCPQVPFACKACGPSSRGPARRQSSRGSARRQSSRAPPAGPVRVAPPAGRVRVLHPQARFAWLHPQAEFARSTRSPSSRGPARRPSSRGRPQAEFACSARRPCSRAPSAGPVRVAPPAGPVRVVPTADPPQSARRQRNSRARRILTRENHVLPCLT